MISKNLFSKLAKEDMKAKMSLVLMSTILMFLNFPIVMAVMLERTTEFVKQDIYTKKQAIDILVHYISGGNQGTMVLTALIACVTAMCQFAYLYQKNQVDFYHGLPIRREKQFFARFINGMLLYIVPYLVFCLMAIAEVSAFGYGQMAILKAAFLGFLINIGGYFLCYATAVLAVCLAGNIFTGICAIVTFLGYGIVATLFIDTMMGKYSQTYVEEYGKIKDLNNYISPIGAYARLTGEMKDSFQLFLWFLGCVAAAVLITLAALWVYRKRKSESAGKPIAFEKSKSVIKLFIMTLIIGCGTLFFSSLGLNAHILWEIIGFIISFILAQIVIQLIFEVDIKAIQGGLKSAFCSGIIVIIVFAGFYFGGEYYDNYQIAWDDLEYAAVYFSNSFNGSYYDMETGKYVDYEAYAFDHMKITDKNLLKDFSVDCIKSQEQNSENTVMVCLKYTMKNGIKVYRHYQVSDEIVGKYILQFVGKQEFRLGALPVLEINPDKVEQIKYYDESSDYRAKYLDITRAEMKELLETYKEEYLSASTEEINEHAPVMSYVLCGDEENGEWELVTAYVYPSFQKTIALLEDKGMKKRELQDKDIKELTVAWWDYKEGEATETVEVTYTEAEKIQELKKYLCLEDYGYYTAFDVDYNLKSNYQITLEAVEESGTITQKSAMFIKEIPEWLEEDLKNTEIQQEIDKTE